MVRSIDLDVFIITTKKQFQPWFREKREDDGRDKEIEKRAGAVARPQRVVVVVGGSRATDVIDGVVEPVCELVLVHAYWCTRLYLSARCTRCTWCAPKFFRAIL